MGRGATRATGQGELGNHLQNAHKFKSNHAFGIIVTTSSHASRFENTLPYARIDCKPRQSEKLRKARRKARSDMCKRCRTGSPSRYIRQLAEKSRDHKKMTLAAGRQGMRSSNQRVPRKAECRPGLERNLPEGQVAVRRGHGIESHGRKNERTASAG